MVDGEDERCCCCEGSCGSCDVCVGGEDGSVLGEDNSSSIKDTEGVGGSTATGGVDNGKEEDVFSSGVKHSGVFSSELF